MKMQQARKPSAGAHALQWCLAMMLALACGAALAQQGPDTPVGSHGSFRPSAQDLGLLPQYCRARVMPRSSPEARRWAGMMGDAWNHIHHYCLAQQHLNDIRFRGLSMAERDKRRKLRRVVAEIGYVEKRVDPNFPLWGEMQAYKTQAQSQLQIMEMR